MYVRALFSNHGNGDWNTNGATIGTISPVFSYKITENNGNSVPTCSIVTKKNNVLFEGNEIRLYASKVNNPPLDTDIIFRGLVTNLEHQTFQTTINCNNWLQIYINRYCLDPLDTFSATMTSTEIILQLACEAHGLYREISAHSALIDNYVDVSGIVNVISITNYDCTNHTIYERFVSLCEMNDTYMYYDYKNFKLYFKERTSLPSINVQVVKKPSFTSNPNMFLDSYTWSYSTSTQLYTITAKGSGFDSGAIIRVLFDLEHKPNGTTISRSGTQVVGTFSLAAGIYHIYILNGSGSVSNYKEIRLGNVYQIAGNPKWNNDSSNVITKVTTLSGSYLDYQSDTSTTGEFIADPTVIYMPFNFSFDTSKCTIIGLYYSTISSQNIQLDNRYAVVDRARSPSNTSIYINLNLMYQEVSTTITDEIVSMKLTIGREMTDGSYSATASTELLNYFGLREKVINQQSWNTFADMAIYTESVQDNWQDGKHSVTLSIYTDDRLLGCGVNIYDAVNEMYFTYSNSITYPILSKQMNNWIGIVTSESTSYPSMLSEIVVSDISVKNDSSTSITNRNLTNTVNNIRTLDPASDIKVDGSKAMTGNLNLSNNQLVNFAVQNVTSL